MKTRIQALEAVAAAAENHAPHDAALRAAIAELRQVEAFEAARYAEALQARGVDCKECGKRFLSRADDYGFCSLGCRLGGGE